MSEQLVNNATTTLNGAINNSVTSITVTTGSVFPSVGNFRLICELEIMLCTARSTNTLTVTRGIEGTTAASHADTTTITHILTAASLDRVILDRIELLIPSAYADKAPATPGTYDEEFVGTADTLPTNWSWTSAPASGDEFKVNTRWPSMLTLHTITDSQYILTRASYAPTGDFGLWWKVHHGPFHDTEHKILRVYIFNSGETEGRCWEIYSSGLLIPRTRALKTVSSSETIWSSAIDMGGGSSHTFYGGLTRTSGNSWNSWISDNGISWSKTGAAESHSFTPAKVKFIIGASGGSGLPPGTTAIDWMRSRTDLLFPRYN